MYDVHVFRREGSTIVLLTRHFLVFETEDPDLQRVRKKAVSLLMSAQQRAMPLFATPYKPGSASSGAANDLAVLPRGSSSGPRLAIAISGGVLEVRVSLQGRVDSARLHIAPRGVRSIALRSGDRNGDGWVDLVVFTGSRELFWTGHVEDLKDQMCPGVDPFPRGFTRPILPTGASMWCYDKRQIPVDLAETYTAGGNSCNGLYAV